jgi:methylglutaconyl-CoA hydratase
MQISQHSPSALKQTKNLIRLCEPRPIDDALQDYTSQLIATVRASSDAKEGIDAFFNKRKPIWQREKDHD